MARTVLRNGREIADFTEPYFVAELNTSHFGDVDVAKQMIDTAKDVGCDCVKFQSWTAESLYSAAHYRANPIARKMVDKFSMNETQLKELSVYAAEVGIDFASTPYAEAEAAFLIEECNAPFIKIASMELNNHPFLRFLGEMKVPLVLSTGMGTLPEIQSAVQVLKEAGNEQLVILHCTSLYPAEPETIRLHNILGLRDAFPDIPIGYSDHTMGAGIPAASVALGACLVEKHFTLDATRIGMDNQMATTPEQMQAVIEACKGVAAALGGTERILTDAEIDQASKMRRSLITNKALSAGHVLTAGDIDMKRPGDGIPPTEFDTVIGKKLTDDLDAEAVIMPEHLSE